MTNLLRRLSVVSLALALLLALSCRPFGRKKPRQLPPTPIPQMEPRQPEVIETPVPPGIDEQLELASLPLPPSVEALGGPIELPPPPRPRPVRRNFRNKQPAAAEEPADAPPAETPAPAPQPRLGEMLTPEELREHAESLVRSLRATRGMLSQILKHKLTADQSQSTARIQTFLRQAEEARQSDLGAAVNLARRAELLAKDLLNQFP